MKCHAYTHLVRICRSGASAYAWKGEQENAHNAVQALLKMMPGYTVSKLAAEDWSKEPAFVKQYARIVEGARKAGLPG